MVPFLSIINIFITQLRHSGLCLRKIRCSGILPLIKQGWGSGLIYSANFTVTLPIPWKLAVTISPAVTGTAAVSAPEIGRAHV